MTYTIATLEVTPSAFEEIAAKLRAAGYDHLFMPDGSIDMYGIAIARVLKPAVLCTCTMPFGPHQCEIHKT